jgi:hypothetical protein
MCKLIKLSVRARYPDVLEPVDAEMASMLAGDPVKKCVASAAPGSPSVRRKFAFSFAASAALSAGSILKVTMS